MMEESLTVEDYLFGLIDVWTLILAGCENIVWAVFVDCTE